jgi:sec-independent protein translocase protein TatC
MKRKTTQLTTVNLSKNFQQDDLTFIEHLHELRTRLSIVAASVVVFGLVGYGIQKQLTHILMMPAGHQKFIYTTPGGGIDFLLKVCIYFGIALSIPVMVYNLFRFVSPVVRERSRKFIAKATLCSAVLALLGVAFGYFIGLPAAISFLSRQFTDGENIEALFTLQSYLSFVTIYLLGSAMLFQIPLIMQIINRIKPLKPSKMMKVQRFVIVIAFLAAAIITPTPDVFNQALIAGPIIMMYQIGVMGVWVTNRGRHGSLYELRRQDAALRAEREAIRQRAVLALNSELPAKVVTAVAAKPVAVQPRVIVPVASFNQATENPSPVINVRRLVIS